jgi:hypothetical protein
MANEERYNYIILDHNGVYAWDASSFTATWNIPFHYFTEYEDNDDVYIQLENCVWNAATNILTSNTCTVIMDGVEALNQKQSDTSFAVLAILPCVILPDDPVTPVVYYTSPSNVDCNNMKLRVNRFQKITLSVKIEDELLSIDGDPYRFILKVSYKKRN